MRNSVEKENKQEIGFFEKYLTLWVAICMVVGVLIGKFMPAVPTFLGKFEYANVSIPIAILIWLMIYPMMLKVDFQSIKNVGKNPKGLFVTWVTNWLIKPFQVATNDLIILIAFTPIVAFLLGVSGVTIPWDTLILSVILFVVIPLVAGVLTRMLLIKNKGKEYFNNIFIPKFSSITTIGLLLTLVIIFSFQGKVILENLLHIILISVPFILQTFLIFFIAYFASKILKLPHNIAAPAGMIGASNFFELAVAVAISLFGTQSPVALATIVGVLVEVPVMLILVKIANNTKGWFKNEQT